MIAPTVVDIEKYPIPSPKRVLGIKSTTIVLLAVVDTPTLHHGKVVTIEEAI